MSKRIATMLNKLQGMCVEPLPDVLSRLISSLATIYVYCASLNVGYVAGSDMPTRMQAILSHNNIFHLLGCVLCIWVLEKPLWIAYGMIVALAATYLPTLTTMSTMGFSGVIFAVIGMEWGRYGSSLMNTLKSVWWLLLIPFFIKQINACYHLWAFAIGYAIGYVLLYIKKYMS